MAKDISAKIGNLGQLSGREIEALWAELHGRPLKAPSRRDFLVLLLAYGMQEKTYGGLSSVTRKRLRAIATAVEADPAAELAEVPRIKPGVRLIREWQGETHTVTVVDNGFMYAGQRYKSLSEVARLITGTRWSGPRFFGLEGNTRQRDRDGH